MQLLFLCLLAGLAQKAWAFEEHMQENLIRLEEKLREALEDRVIDKAQLTPLTLVEVSSEQEDPKLLKSQVLRSLQQGLRVTIQVCEACQVQYTTSERQSIYSSGMSDLEDVRRIYAQSSSPPKAAAWVVADGLSLSVRIVSLETSQVLFADTIDARIDWSARSLQSFSQSRLAERSARGDAILHSHWDLGLNPLGGGSAHIGYSYMQQWGSSNQYLSGLAFQITDPVLGFGFVSFKAFPELKNALVGGKLLFNTPQLLARSVSSSAENSSGDPLVNVVLMVKYPLFARPEKFYANAFLGTSGTFGVGLSW